VRYLIIYDINVENTIAVLKFKLAVERIYNREIDFLQWRHFLAKNSFRNGEIFVYKSCIILKYRRLILIVLNRFRIV